MYMSIDSAYMTHTQVQDFIFLLSTQNKLLDPFMNLSHPVTKVWLLHYTLFSFKNNKKILNSIFLELWLFIMQVE